MLKQLQSAVARAIASGRRAWQPEGPAAEPGFGRLEPVLVVTLVVWSAVPGLWFGRDQPGLPAVDLGLAVAGAVQALPLLWRRRAPEAVVVAGGLAVGAGLLLVHDRILPSSIALLVAAYSLPVYARQPQPAWVGWAAWVVAAVALALLSDYVTAGPMAPPDSLFLLWMAGAWAAGRVRRQYLDLRDKEREQHTRQALTAERTRIARELHDLLAHSMSSVVVLAGIAQRVATTRPERAQELLAAIESTGREGLQETQRLLGVLRSDVTDAHQLPDAADKLTPAPRLRRLGELVDSARRAGLDVRVEVDGDPLPLPAGVELSAYRIVQEALTNTVRHAAATTAWLILRYTGDALEVEVRDNGTAPEPGHRPGDRDHDGYGLVGMRERAATVGGTLEAGPGHAGGWRVLARLPARTQGGTR